MKRVLSGIRPTGKLHLGHLVGILNNWEKLQQAYDCYFMVADLHAYMSEYKNPKMIDQYILDNVADWILWGVDPQKSCIFVQSAVPEHLKLYFYLSLVTPLGRLYRCPSFKEQLRELKEKEINTLAFLGYPILQAADILIYKADTVPVGEDQLPHLELTREIVRRFHFIYKKEIFPEPQPMFTQMPKLLGTDGRKMSKSYQNCVYLDEEETSLRQKIMNMITDPARIKLTDPGHPDICNVYAFYKSFSSRHQEVYEWCVNAKKGCTQCKKELFELMNDLIAPRRKKKQELLAQKDVLTQIVLAGNVKAQEAARETIREVEVLFHES